MNEMAAAYYESRAREMGVSVPPILQGRPVLLAGPESVTHSRLGGTFEYHMEGVEPYVLAGILFMEGRPAAEWERIRGRIHEKSSPDSRILTAVEYGSGSMALHLIREYSAGSRIFLEAIAPDEVPKSSYAHAIGNKPAARSRKQEMARVFLLARTIAPDGESRAAWLTVLWGEYKVRRYGKISDKKSLLQHYLTPRYMGAKVLEREMQPLPLLLE